MGDKILLPKRLKAGGSSRCDIVSELAKYYIAKWSWYKRSFHLPLLPQPTMLGKVYLTQPIFSKGLGRV
jgi:hypothetical protein